MQFPCACLPSLSSEDNAMIRDPWKEHQCWDGNPFPENWTQISAFHRHRHLTRSVPDAAHSKQCSPQLGNDSLGCGTALRTQGLLSLLEVWDKQRTFMSPPSGKVTCKATAPQHHCAPALPFQLLTSKLNCTPSPAREGKCNSASLPWVSSGSGITHQIRLQGRNRNSHHWTLLSPPAYSEE